MEPLILSLGQEWRPTLGRRSVAPPPCLELNPQLVGAPHPPTPLASPYTSPASAGAVTAQEVTAPVPNTYNLTRRAGIEPRRRIADVTSEQNPRATLGAGWAPPFVNA